MQSTPSINPTSLIRVPEIASDGPVAVIPTASVAPLDGPPDGERINTFTLAPPNNDRAIEHSTADTLGNVRDRVLGKPLTYLGAALVLGFVIARVLR